jgi:hypothetical protein
MNKEDSLFNFPFSYITRYFIAFPGVTASTLAIGPPALINFSSSIIASPEPTSADIVTGERALKEIADARLALESNVALTPTRPFHSTPKRLVPDRSHSLRRLAAKNAAMMAEVNAEQPQKRSPTLGRTRGMTRAQYRFVYSFLFVYWSHTKNFYYIAAKCSRFFARGQLAGWKAHWITLPRF